MQNDWEFLKYTMPTAVRIRPRFSSQKKFKFFSIFFQLNTSFKLFMGFLLL